MNLKLFKGLLHFTLPTYSVFCTLTLQVQNQVIYLPSFIIVYNVHFLRVDIIFFLREGMCSPREWGQKGQFFKILTGFLFLRSSFSSSLFIISLSFLFPSWPMLDKHLSISFSSVKKYPPRKSFGFAKIFLENFAILCDVVLPDSWFELFQKESFGFTKIFLKKKLVELCDVGLLDSWFGFFQKAWLFFIFYFYLWLWIGGNHTKLKCFFPFF